MSSFWPIEKIMIVIVMLAKETNENYMPEANHFQFQNCDFFFIFPFSPFARWSWLSDPSFNLCKSSLRLSIFFHYVSHPFLISDLLLSQIVSTGLLRSLLRNKFFHQVQFSYLFLLMKNSIFFLNSPNFGYMYIRLFMLVFRYDWWKLFVSDSIKLG